MSRWRRVAIIGPHPVRIVRTVLFLLLRRARAERLRRRYDRLAAVTRPSGRFVVPRVEVPVADAVPPPLAPAVGALLEEAEAVLAHRVDFLGSGEVALGDAIDWHQDFKSGYTWPAVFYQDIEMTRLDDRSDAKVPWELSRGHQLLTLARAARITGERRFVDELEAQLADWLRSNPPGRGINWTTPMELGFRAVNWLWVFGTLTGIDIDSELRDEVARSLYWHAVHITENLEGTPYLRSNHYLGNILGLLAIGAAFPDDGRARRWYRRAHRAFERQIVRQVYADGVGFEGSLAYHGLSLEMFLVARRIADLAGRPFGSGYDDQLSRMLDVVRAARHDDGRIPLFGDQDSGRLLPAGFARPATTDNLVWVGAALLGTGRPLPGPPHPEVMWNLGIDDYLGVQDASPAPPPPRAFARGGLYVLDGAGTHVVVRCGDVGQNGAGGHAHNDVTSYELSRARPLIVDSGTYAYTFDVEARNEMRSSRAHNVTVLEGLETNPIDERQVFRLVQVADPHVESWRDDEQQARLVVSHDGYRRLDPPVGVRRTLSVSKTTGELSVCDEISGAGRHTLETFVHLTPDASVELVDDRAFVIERGGERARIAFEGPGIVAQTQPCWVSEHYGRRDRSQVIVGRVTTELPTRIVYRVGFDETAGGHGGPARSGASL